MALGFAGLISSEISGAIVAVYGILSIIPDKIPEAHKIIIVAAFKLPPVSVIKPSARNFMPPFASKPPIIINKPTKKNIVSHSTSRYISFGYSNNTKNAAPATANTKAGMCVIS